MPPALDIAVLSDRTQTIRASVADVEMELILAVILVVLVIFVFLRNAPATLIPSLSVPLSLVGTFGAMYLLNYSLDNLSLMALTIATGFVVDDAIVMIENIARYIEAGDAPLAAALKGSQQIGFTIISLTVSLIAALIPLLFMGEIVGRLFHEFAITLAVTIVISAAVSLTLVPMLCARLLHHRPAAARGAWDLRAERGFQWIVARYERGLNWVLDRQGLTLAFAGVTLLVSLLLYVLIPKGFFPVQDTGEIQGISEAAQTISYAAMAERQQALSAAILKDPDVASLSSFIGVDGSNSTLNCGRFLINLKPHAARRASASDVIRHLTQETAGVVGIALYMQPLQDITIDSAVSRTQYQFVIESTDSNDFAAWIPPLVQKLSALPQLADVASDLEQQGTATDLTIDRATAARFGITPATVDNVLYDSFGQRIVSTIYSQSNQYRVILEADPSIQLSLAGLSELYLPSSTSSSNGQVPLSAIVQVSQRPGPLQITHLGQFPATTISFNLAPGASLGGAVDAIRKAEQGIKLPGKFVTAFQGTAAAFQHVLTNQALLLAASVITMYIVLGVLYESFIHPITILSTLPSAGIGAMLALILARHDLDVLGIIGIILLIGIVKKNAIMMIDFALDAQRKGGLGPREAITQASLLRFRPILMTTMAALFGALPLMLSYGAGFELRRPLGIAIVGGLIVSQLLTLFTTPVIYLAFDRLAARRRSAAAAKGNRPDPAPGMNISKIFIERPVATTLLTAGIALAGAFAYLQLPVAPLPQVDYPTISVSASLPGRRPGDGLHQCRRAPRAVSGRNCRRYGDHLAKLHRSDAHYAAVRSRSRHQRRRARRAGRDQCRRRRCLDQPFQQSHLSEGESGRCAADDSGADLRDVDPRPTLRCGEQRAAAAALAARRNRSGLDRRGDFAGGARGAESRRHVPLRHRLRGRARGARLRERKQPEGRDRGGGAPLPALYQRSSAPMRASTGRCSSPTATARRCGCRTSPMSRTRCRI